MKRALFTICTQHYICKYSDSNMFRNYFRILNAYASVESAWMMDCPVLEDSSSSTAFYNTHQ